MNVFRNSQRRQNGVGCNDYSRICSKRFVPNTTLLNHRCLMGQTAQTVNFPFVPKRTGNYCRYTLLSIAILDSLKKHFITGFSADEDGLFQG